MVSIEMLLTFTQVDQVHHAYNGSFWICVLPLVYGFKDTLYNVFQLFRMRWCLLITSDIDYNSKHPLHYIRVGVFEQDTQWAEYQWVADALLQEWIPRQIGDGTHSFDQDVFVQVGQVDLECVYNANARVEVNDPVPVLETDDGCEVDDS